MRIHHVDCASMCPMARSATNGDGGLFERGSMPAHCLIVETERHGLVLVDTGIGEADVRDPGGRLGRLFANIVGILPGRTTVAGPGTGCPMLAESDHVVNDRPTDEALAAAIWAMGR